MKNKKIVLINPNPTRNSVYPVIDDTIIRYHQMKDAIGTERGDQRHEPNNGLLSIGAILIKEKYETEYLDLNALEINYFRKTNCYYSQDQIHQILDEKTTSIDFALVSCLTSSVHSAISIIYWIKQINPKCTIILGGVFPTLNPDYCIEQCTGIDALVIGEGEIIILKILAAFISNDFETLNMEEGIIYKLPGKTDYIVKKGQNIVKDLNLLELPAYQLLQKESEPHVYRIFTARGCSSACSFCAPSFVSKHRLRKLSPDNVITAILNLKHQLKAKSFLIGDLTFLDHQKHGREILHRMIEEKINLPFWCQTRLDRINEENIALLAKAGCRQIAIGVESYNDSILTLINKGISVDEMVKKLLMVKRYGIQVQGYFIVGLPNETVKHIERTIKFVEYSIQKGYLDLTHISIYVPYPGLPLPENVHIIDRNYDNYHQGVFLDMPPTPVYETKLLDKQTIFDLWLKLLHKVTVAYKEKPNISDWLLDNPDFVKETTLGTEALTIGGEIEEHANQSPIKRSVFNIVQGTRDTRHAFVSKLIYEDDNYIIGDAELYTNGQLISVLTTIDGVVDYILLDADIKTETSRQFIDATYRTIKKSKIYPYSDLAIWCRATFLHIQHEIDHIEDASICLSPVNIFSTCLSGMLENRGAHVMYYDGSKIVHSKNGQKEEPVVHGQKIDLLVNFSFGKSYIDKTILDKLSGNSIIIDATTEGIHEPLYEYLHENHFRILRPEMRPLLSSQMWLLEKFENYITSSKGCIVSEGYRFISGGLIGKNGDVVVDSIKNPTRIIGIADGKGKILRPEQLMKADIEKITKANTVLAKMTSNGEMRSWK